MREETLNLYVLAVACAMCLFSVWLAVKLIKRDPAYFAYRECAWMHNADPLDISRCEARVISRESEEFRKRNPAGLVNTR